jgi:hypothetical protein
MARRPRVSDVPAKGFFYHNPSHRYFYNGEKMTGVTTVLGIVGDSSNLIQWAANQAAVNALVHSKDSDAFAEAVINYKKIGTREANELDKLFPEFKEARTAHLRIRDTAADIGKAGHKMCEEYELAKMGLSNWRARDYEPEVVKRGKPYIQWYKKNVAKTHFVERPLFSKKHFVAGTPDGGFQLIDGRNLINDKKFKEYIYDPSPFWQMAAYRMMLEEMASDKKTPIQIDWGEGRIEKYKSPAEYLHTFGAVKWEGMHCDTYKDDKESFLSALHLYRSIGAFKNRVVTVDI